MLKLNAMLTPLIAMCNTLTATTTVQVACGKVAINPA